MDAWSVRHCGLFRKERARDLVPFMMKPLSKGCSTIRAGGHIADSIAGLAAAAFGFF